jgi:hypothetical protein
MPRPYNRKTPNVGTTDASFAAFAAALLAAWRPVIEQICRETVGKMLGEMFGAYMKQNAPAPVAAEEPAPKSPNGTAKREG